MLSSNLYLRSIAISKEIPKGNYLKDLPVVKNLTEMGSLSFSKNVTFFVGENGVGKSTLIEAIAWRKLYGISRKSVLWKWIIYIG